MKNKIAHAKYYSMSLNKINLFYDGNGRTCKVVFANDYKITF